MFVLQRANAPLGISIAGGVGSPLGDVPIFVALVHDRGPARGKIKVSNLVCIYLKYGMGRD